MQTWDHVYTPFGSVWLSALVALIPIVFFFIALAGLRLKGYVAGALTMMVSIVVAVIAFNMPVAKAFSAALYGFGYGLWPISWIIIATVFLYKLSVKSGKFEIIRQSILAITNDQRLQVLLISFAFGSFLEGAAGFGTPVAICAAILVGLGFKPLYAAALCLIANTAPVAYGALGVPIIVAGEVTGLDAFDIGAMTGRQLPILSLLVPFLLVFILDGLRGIKEVWPAAIVAGVAFGSAQFITANFIGPELPNITASFATIISLTIFFRFWQPKRIMKPETAQNADNNSEQTNIRYSLFQQFHAWSPFVLLTVMVTLWTMPTFKSIAKVFDFNFNVPFLYESVFRVEPIVQAREVMDATFKFNPLGATGTAIFISALISMLILRVTLPKAIEAFKETLQELKFAILSIGMVLGFAFVMNYSGMSGTLALVLASTGFMFPFFSPFLGWLGVFLTGSDTTSNALFGALQASTANQLGLDPVLMNAANTSGGGSGKMISPQSISIACAATGLVGRESELFRFTLKYSLFFAMLFGILTFLQSYVFTWMLV
ncbi:lactate permease LctP family transporter [Thorsellia anophelis]|uniref:L-lactate permease n=1 Tax=Thorsellia anophelis DSM 18579 TaxID=1123402 RepID=A0A1H9Z980_9GAMM|nr:lactate permease LctP family transporter [Thorsellia anophelis]SES78070.1 lactate permease [Thorsellia anophelis DSM 18579]